WLRPNRHLILDAFAGSSFISRLLSVVVDKMKRYFLPRSGTGCGDTDRCRCLESAQARSEQSIEIRQGRSFFRCLQNSGISPPRQPGRNQVVASQTALCDIVRRNIKEHMRIEKPFANLLEAANSRDLPFMHAAAG